jgi:lipid-binding SYLF domain-containing protein
MNLSRFVASSFVALAFVAGPAAAQTSDKAKKQEEVLKAAEVSLADFYKADPKIKTMVDKAPGYAVFKTYGLSFVLGGAGGKGVVYERATKKHTYMELALASAGAQIGASDTRYLFIFKDTKDLRQFIDSGWDANVAGGGSAGTGSKTAGSAEGAFTGGALYTLTKAGLQAGGAAAGAKAWKDKELN